MKRYELLEIEIIHVGDDIIATSQKGDNNVGNVDDLFGNHNNASSLSGLLGD